MRIAIKKQEKEMITVAYAAVIEHLRGQKQTQENMALYDAMKKRLRDLREG